MTPKSKKAKGRRFQNWVRDQLVEWYGSHFGELIVPKQMGGAGIDIELYGEARKEIPFDIECKNTERLNIWDAMKQAEANTGSCRAPLLVFKRNRSEVYVAMKWDDFLRSSNGWDHINALKDTQP